MGVPYHQDAQTKRLKLTRDQVCSKIYSEQCKPHPCQDQIIFYHNMLDLLDECRRIGAHGQFRAITYAVRVAVPTIEATINHHYNDLTYGCLTADAQVTLARAKVRSLNFLPPTRDHKLMPCKP